MHAQFNIVSVCAMYQYYASRFTRIFMLQFSPVTDFITNLTLRSFGPTHHFNTVLWECYRLWKITSYDLQSCVNSNLINTKNSIFLEENISEDV